MTVMKKLIIIFTLLLLPFPSLAVSRDLLADIYYSRPDLHASFEPERLRAIPGSGAGFLIDLEDWAEQYGWRENPLLTEFRPVSAYIPEAESLQDAIPEVTAANYLIMDRQSRQILAAKNANVSWPIASITKLMTANVALDKHLPIAMQVAIRNKDNVGGARLWVEDGEEVTIDALYYATLVSSANNAANTLARATGFSNEGFLRAMNGRADLLNLSRTRFADPTGIELGNISTARETARLAEEIFEKPEVRKYTTTSHKTIRMRSSDTTKRLKSTNWMLYHPEYEDVFVMGGKTGYLHESKWNLVVNLRPEYKDSERELMLVVFGSESRTDLFKDAKKLADWTWENFDWKENAYGKVAGVSDEE